MSDRGGSARAPVRAGSRRRAPAPDRTYVYMWANNVRRAELKGRACVVVARGAMATVLVEFLDSGERVTTSARALRRESPAT